jgi:sugar lactone lactonase YvrE
MVRAHRTLAVLAGVWSLAAVVAAIAAPTSDLYKIERIVEPSAFHGVHGLAIDAQGRLFAGTVTGESIYSVDTRTGKTNVVIGPPEGMADDMVFLADGTLVWTSISQNKVRARKGDGPIRELASDLPSVNSIAVRKDGRLFVAQVFGGDGLWELDPAGVEPPRNILKNIGGLNGFDIGADGMIYGPLWFKHQVVRIDPDSGALSVVADGFGIPAAANFDSKGNLYVLDTARGELVRVNVANGSKEVAAKLSTSLDNLAIDAQDRVFVSNMADNGVQVYDSRTGRVQQVVKGALANPRMLAVAQGASADQVFVADVFAYRVIDGRTGKVTDLSRAFAAGNEAVAFVIGVGAGPKHGLVLDTAGTLQITEVDSNRVVRKITGLPGTTAALELADGSVLIAEGAGRLVRLTGSDGKTRKVIASGLNAPQALALAPGRPAAVYVLEAGAAQIARIELEGGKREVIAKDLARPNGLTVDANGKLYVIEAAQQRLVRIDPKTGAVTTVATGLPVGAPGLSSFSAGLAAGSRGVLYVSSDIENSVYRLSPR